MGSPGSTGELELVPVATSVPSIAVLYRAEHVPMVRRLTLMGSPATLSEVIAHRAFRLVGRDWDLLDDPLTVVRRVALEDLMARYRPPGRAPTLSPPREGAPAAWAAVGAVLDPLAPEARVARVLQVYDGLDDATVDDLLPVPKRGRSRREPAPPTDLGLAGLFADAVADVSPASRLTDLIVPRSVQEGDILDRHAATPRTPWSSSRVRRWVGAAAAVAVVGVLGSGLDADLGAPATRGQEVRAGSGLTAGTAEAFTLAAAQSSCPSADPVIGPGGTPLPEEGDTEPRRVARVLATDRHALVALHRGGRDARIISRDGRVRRTGPNGVGRVRNIEAGADDQIQVVIRSAGDCPANPEAWKGIPLVFTTLAAAAAQPDVVTAGALDDRTPWEVRDRPGHGLCAKLGDKKTVCGAAAAEEERLLPVRLLTDGAGRRVVFGYLPAAATTARLEHLGGELGPPATVPEDATFFAFATGPGDTAARVRFFDRGGAAVTAVLLPTA